MDQKIKDAWKISSYEQFSWRSRIERPAPRCVLSISSLFKIKFPQKLICLKETCWQMNNLITCNLINFCRKQPEDAKSFVYNLEFAFCNWIKCYYWWGKLLSWTQSAIRLLSNIFGLGNQISKASLGVDLACNSLVFMVGKEWCSLSRQIYLCG